MAPLTPTLLFQRSSCTQHSLGHAPTPQTFPASFKPVPAGFQRHRGTFQHAQPLSGAGGRAASYGFWARWVGEMKQGQGGGGSGEQLSLPQQHPTSSFRVLLRVLFLDPRAYSLSRLYIYKTKEISQTTFPPTGSTALPFAQRPPPSPLSPPPSHGGLRGRGGEAAPRLLLLLPPREGRWQAAARPHAPRGRREPQLGPWAGCRGRGGAVPSRAEPGGERPAVPVRIAQRGAGRRGPVPTAPSGLRGWQRARLGPAPDGFYPPPPAPPASGVLSRGREGEAGGCGALPGLLRQPPGRPRRCGVGERGALPLGCSPPFGVCSWPGGARGELA